MRVDCKFLNFKIKIKKPLKFQGLKLNFSHIKETIPSKPKAGMLSTMKEITRGRGYLVWSRNDTVLGFFFFFFFQI
jgi:hypothetical protein